MGSGASPLSSQLTCPMPWRPLAGAPRAGGCRADNVRGSRWEKVGVGWASTVSTGPDA